MDRNSPYYQQVALLIKVLPFVAKETCFALKGGTAINLFVREFPRLSVDIDLAYTLIEPREDALRNVRLALSRIVEDLNQVNGLNADLQDTKPDEMRIIVRSTQATIKIELSPVARGTLYDSVEMDIIESAEDEFGFASIKVLSLPDLYGGKLCAALDRQHPRDLFDVKMLLEAEGIDRAIFNGFITYLLSHNRPISEVLNPHWKDITESFLNEFNGMTFEQVSLEALNEVPDLMLAALKQNFTQQDYDFLMSFKQGKPDWPLAPSEQLRNLPAIKWKLLNIQKMNPEKHGESLRRLEVVLKDWLAFT